MMSQALIRHHRLHAPYFIFVRSARVYSDIELLHHLGVANISRDLTPSRATKSVFVTEDQQWAHVADDWSYTLWHSPNIRTAIAHLATRHDIFTCSVGDIDLSFDFAYYQNTHLVRHYAVDATLYGKRSVITNVGNPLPSEAEAMQAHDGLDIVLKIAQSLGINTHHDLQTIRTYTHI